MLDNASPLHQRPYPEKKSIQQIVTTTIILIASIMLEDINFHWSEKSPMVGDSTVSILSQCLPINWEICRHNVLNCCDIRFLRDRIYELTI